MTSPTVHTLSLNNGLQIPVLGLGTAENLDQSGLNTLKKLVKERVYVHIDTASFYQNEEGIGKALQELFAEGVKREDIFVTTKIFPTEIKDVNGAFHASLKRLGLDFVDLYLLHWPIASEGFFEGAKLIRVPLHETWAKMECLVHKGLVRSIGVSNFNFQLLNDLLSYAKIKPVCNQIELHPYLAQHDFVEWLKSEGIVPVAYSPLAKGLGDGKTPVPLTDPVVHKIAVTHNRSAGQIILAWHIARGHVLIPKSSRYERAIENASIFDIKLTDAEIKKINDLDRGYRVIDNKNWGGPLAKLPIWN